ncbi:hypothetical protein GCM10023201_20240 [Actinomycetospora corticicola]|uniref:Ferredoxin-NADP reductase n=1 Tax=Actinomycetospora corticicola TaxID=663602 RepID=A0A7Y9DS92_9PSEU|nr:hypothetical protein [Actinomycetospora corticicola]NYD34439.1 hypothetical protein [Actinomycetospora corticicola]
MSVATLPVPAVTAAPAPAPQVADPARLATRPMRWWLLAVLGANLVAAGTLVVLGLSPAAAATMASIDVGLAALIRQQDVVNGLFALATRTPRSWPLRVRAAIAQVHQVGAGVHVGAAISAIAWFLAFTVLTALAPPTPLRPAVLGIAAGILVVLVVMAALARPSARERHHDRFEHSHRWGGWASLALFAALTVVLAADAPTSFAVALATTPGTWILLAVAVAAVVPWLQLRRLPVTIDTPSDHVALVTADRGRPVRIGSATRIARHPLGQWHAFATVARPDRSDFRLAVSRAGNWTGAFIDDRPDHVWVRGVPTTGVGSVSRMFHGVVWIATGSGIAPVLPHLLGEDTPAHLVWVTRNPERTYGAELVADIRAADPTAVFWDTDANGKPDLVALAARAVAETGAEAVVCISNRRTTLRVVGELRRRGIPAYGPIWDS